MSGLLLAIRLEELRPIEAVEVAACAALSERHEERLDVAEALCWIFPLVGDEVVLDHLAGDPCPMIRFAVARAAHARRSVIGDALLRRLLVDDDPRVAGTAAFALLFQATEIVSVSGRASSRGRRRAVPRSSAPCAR